MIDIFDLFIHVYWHGGYYLPYVLGSLLVVLFHEVIFLQDPLGNWLELSHLGLNLVSLMSELLVLLFQVLN